MNFSNVLMSDFDGSEPVPATGPLDPVTVLRVWRSRARQRRALADLDPRLLADIGIDRAAAAREARKPFWRD